MPKTTEGLPKWIINQSDDLKKSLTPQNQLAFDNIVQKMRELWSMHQCMPSEFHIAEVYNVNPRDMQKLFSDPVRALMFACEFTIATFHFSHISKNKSYLIGLKSALNENNYLVSMACLRGILEELAHYGYFARRLQQRRRVLDKTSNPPKKKGQAYVKWFEKLSGELMEIVTLMRRAVHGSDYDWSSWFKNIYSEHGVLISEDETSEIKKLHINDCLRDLEKKTKSPIVAYYDLLSEMVHPNRGSQMLVIDSRIRIDDLRGDLIPCLSA